MWRALRLPVILSCTGCQLIGGIGDVSLRADAASTDVTADGGAAPDAAVADCSKHLFCADFDDGPDPTTGWTATVVNGGGSIALETSQVRSPPNAFASRMAPGSDYAAAALGNGWPFTARSAHLAHFLLLEQIDLASDILCVWSFGVGNVEGANSLVRAYVTPDSAQLNEEYTDEKGARQSQSAKQPFRWPVNRWLGVQGKVDVTTRTATLEVEGAPVVRLSLAGRWIEAGTFLKLGIFYSRGLSGQRVIYDDVIFDAAP